MKSSISARLLFGLMLILLALQPAHAQNFKCFVLRPPAQLLDSVKTVAVADLGVSTRYISSEIGSASCRERV